MGALSTIPRARHARSPNERPKDRVWGTIEPAIFACSASKSAISGIGAVTAPHASSEPIPIPTSLPYASATFTALIVAFLSNPNCWAKISAPGSSWRIARRAEASSTILFTPRRLAALGYQFVHQRRGLRHMFAHQLLGFGQALPQSCHSQLIVFDAENHGIAGLDAKGTTERGWNYNSTVFINPSMTLYLLHDTLHVMT